MTVFWRCKTTANSEYCKKIEYVSDPSADLIGRFKDEIVSYYDPSKHKDCVPCEDAEKARGHLLFMLGNKAEVLIRPDHKGGRLCFMDYDDV